MPWQAGEADTELSLTFLWLNIHTQTVCIVNLAEEQYKDKIKRVQKKLKRVVASPT